jgi:hypothetical protein
MSLYIFDKKKSKVVQIGRGEVKKNDAHDLKSFQMGCPDVKEQKNRLERMEKAGISGCSYCPETGQLIAPDRHTQLKAARFHGYEVD